MKVAARRANGVFIGAPLVIIISCSLDYLLWYARYVVRDYYVPNRIMALLSTVAIAAVFELAERIWQPRILIECDESGILVHTSRFKSQYVLYSEFMSALCSSDFEEEHNSILRPGYINNMMNSNIKSRAMGTGKMIIRTKTGSITVRNIYHVNEAAAVIGEALHNYVEKKYAAIM